MLLDKRLQKEARGKRKPAGEPGAARTEVVQQVANHQQNNFSLRRLHEGWFPNLSSADIGRLSRFVATGFGNYTYMPLKEKSLPGKLVFSVEFERRKLGQTVGKHEYIGIFEIDLTQRTIKRFGLNV